MNDKEFNQRIQEKADLILRYLRGATSPEEEAALQQWLAEDEQNHSFLASLEEDSANEEVMEFFSSTDVPSAWKKVSAQTIHKRKIKTPATRVWRYAAVITLVIATAATVYYLMTPSSPSKIADREIPSYQNDIAPGGNKATLELADGTIVLLEQAKNGKLASSMGIQIIKQNGRLIYDMVVPDLQQVSYNKVSTPNGGQYQIVLPDGSKAWLNAASSLRFPTAFVGEERVVELNGEAYFEIEKDAKKPFRVKVGDVSVNVLGTNFNVSAYDASVSTTLLEGSVEVTKGVLSQMISPGEQARVTDTIQLMEVDTSQVVAWKNGFFQFSHTGLPDIMKQLERWYDVEVDYKQLPEIHFTGTISRNNNISKVLNMLELTSELRFEIDGDKIMIAK